LFLCRVNVVHGFFLFHVKSVLCCSKTPTTSEAGEHNGERGTDGHFPLRRYWRS